jgi:nicotinamidase-related amidase
MTNIDLKRKLRDEIDVTLEEVAEFYASEGMGANIGIGRKACLIIIDLQRAETDPKLNLGAELGDEIARTNEVLEIARQVGAPVIFTVVAYPVELEDIWLQLKKIPAMVRMKEGSPYVELDHRLVPRPGERILHKRGASAFFGTDLLSCLNMMGVDTLMLAGYSTSGCVRATAVDAMQYGFRALIIRECVGDRCRLTHEISLLDLHSRYADVISVDEAKAKLLDVTYQVAR